MNITYEILTEFKNRMHLGDDEDDNLMQILSTSLAALQKDCGNYDIEADREFKELVFERSRYVYNDALEYFDKYFLNRITTLGVNKALDEIVLEDDTDATV